MDRRDADPRRQPLSTAAVVALMVAVALGAWALGTSLLEITGEPTPHHATAPLHAAVHHVAGR